MKILLVTYWAYPHLGGVSTYMDVLQSRLEEIGHEVEILAQHPDFTKYYLVKSGQMIEKSPHQELAEPAVMNDYRNRQVRLTPWMSCRENEKYAFESVCRQLQLDQYDLIHTQDIISTFVLRRTKPAAVPLVATIHGCLASEWVTNNEIQTRTQFEQEYLSLEEYFGAMTPDSLILPSRWLSNSLSKFQISHPNTHIIPYGLDQQAFQSLLRNQAQAELFVSMAKSKIIACPARLVAIKGQTYLLKAMELLVRERKDVVCWLIGDGVMQNDLERQVRQLELQDHVKFLGKRSNVPELLSTADIVVLPSLQDNLPFAVMEAQSLGKPVVASKVGGIVEMIEDGINGLLAEPRNAQELFEKLLLLIENEPLRNRLSNEAMKHANKEWNDLVMIEKTLDVYKEASEGRNRKVLFSKHDFSDELIRRYLKLAPTAVETDRPSVSTVQGIIHKAKGGNGIPQADVHLFDISGVILRSIKTNRHGEFEFPNIQQGNYALTCSGSDYGMSTQKITVTRQSPLVIKMML